MFLSVFPTGTTHLNSAALSPLEFIVDNSNIIYEELEVFIIPRIDWEEVEFDGGIFEFRL